MTRRSRRTRTSSRRSPRLRRCSPPLSPRLPLDPAARSNVAASGSRVQSRRAHRTRHQGRDSPFPRASSRGVGTYLGPTTDDADAAYEAAIARAFDLGINVVDAAINYRNQRSERAAGRALAAAAARGIARDEIVVATKGGFIPRGLVP